MKYADLHVHTNYSDSTFTPEEVVSLAGKRGLAAIAICDHDCVDGIKPCQDVAKRSNIDVEIIPAVELTAEKDGIEIHLLGYFVDWQDASFQKDLNVIRNSRVERIYKMADRLKAHGIDISPEDVFKLAPKGSVGRLHFARAMLKSGKVRTLEEAFNKYIGASKPCYVAHLHFEPREAIELILRVKGVPVVAHPCTMGRDDFIDEFKKYGLKGIEVYHSDHDTGNTKRYEALAKRLDLVATGGSDCHGLGKARILLGEVRVPYDVVEALRKESKW